MSQQVYDKPDPSISKLWEAEKYPVADGYNPYMVGGFGDELCIRECCESGRLQQWSDWVNFVSSRQKMRWRPIFVSTEPFPPRPPEPPEVKIELAEYKGDPRVLLVIGNGPTRAFDRNGVYLGESLARERYTNIRPYSPSAS